MVQADKITLGIIFKRIKDDESFTDDAQLYQKILTVSILGSEHQFFTRWEMCRWLKDNHQPFQKRSVESLQQLVERKIKKLIELELIHIIGTQQISTATGETSVYAFHLTSYFLAWLIESLSADSTTRTNAHNKIFNILYLMLEMDTPSSMKTFLKSLLWKFKEKNLFAYPADHMIELLESDNAILDISDLVNQTLVFGSTNSDFVTKFNQLWEQTLNELEPKMKQLVMFRMKLLYEQRMKHRAHDLALFERARFGAREMFDKLVVECGCLSCFCITYEMIDLMEYMIRLRYHFEGYPALEIDCPSCKVPNLLQIIDL